MYNLPFSLAKDPSAAFLPHYEETSLDVLNTPIVIAPSSAANIEPNTKDHDNTDTNSNSPLHPNGHSKVTVTSDESLFLNKIPLEIRRQIYSYLLVNPDLAKGSPRSGAIILVAKQTNYDLSPAILRVCKQTYEEGFEIIYDNRFLVDCIGWNYLHHPPMVMATDLFRTYDEDRDNIRCKNPRWITEKCTNHRAIITPCPITRWDLSEFNYSCCSQRPIMCYIPSIKHARHWKVLVSGTDWRESILNLREFCRAISLGRVASITILIMPLETTGVTDFASHSLDEIFVPLRMLRNIRHIELCMAKKDDIPGYWSLDGPIDWTVPSVPINPSAQIKEECTTLIMGNSPIEYTHLMFDSLLTYAQTFERIPEFKKDMSFLHESIKYRTPIPVVRNPFKFWPPHPIERHLEIAQMLVINDQMEQFKECRGQLLEYLETSYQNISRCSFNLNEFIKREKRHRGIFGAHKNYHADFIPIDCGDMTEGIFLLEKYAHSFSRHLPHCTELAIRAQKKDFIALYNELSREKLMDRIDKVHENGKAEEFVQLFKEIVGDLEKQFIEIRDAKKELFKWDILGDQAVPSNIKIPQGEYELVNWDVMEPNIGVEMDWHSW